MNTDPTTSNRVPAIGAKVVISLLLLFGLIGPTAAATLPDGFFEEVAIQGNMYRPTAMRIAPDGRVFVIEKLGVVKVFDSVNNPTPHTIVDLGDKVHAYLDRGLLGLEVDPQFPTRPYIYILYTYNYDPNDPGISAPRWPQFSCPDPPGGEVDGCVVNGRLSRLQISPTNQLVGTEQVLLENHWCQQFPSHSIGGLSFGSDGALYVSAGDGASYLNPDYGQYGGSSGSPTPKNACGDPPSGRGGTQTPPLAEGGALRAQDIRSGNDEATFDGAILRVDPNTGAALPDNPLIGGDPSDDRIVAYGFRNPFRIAARPGTQELWVGDVGWGAWEEIDRVQFPLSTPVRDFGWPCYEGPNAQPAYQGQNLDLCKKLYTDVNNPPQAPYYAYNHDFAIDPPSNPIQCSRTGSSSVTGLAFYNKDLFPPQYKDALFFADYSRKCIFVMLKGADGNPDTNTRQTFEDLAASPVDLQVGPDGFLYYVDHEAARIMRIKYAVGNRPPNAVAASDRSNGPLPLTVTFDGSQSSDPDAGATLSYAWDLDGDGSFDDATGVSPIYTYTQPGVVNVSLKVSDQFNASDTDTIPIIAGNSAPTARILEPTSSLKWRVGQEIFFRGDAPDPEQGFLPPSAFHWEIVLFHCPGGPGDCHEHTLETIDGVDHGSFQAPDHEYYAYLEIRLTVTDAGFANGTGRLSASSAVDIEAMPSTLTFNTDPPGLPLIVGPNQVATPFTDTYIVNSAVSVTAAATQTIGTDNYQFLYWTDGGDASHLIHAPETPTTFTAVYAYSGPTFAWWNLDFRSRSKLTIDNNLSPETFSDFPLMVALNSSRIDYNKTQNQGQDLRFVAADGVTPLAYEIERWDEAGTSTSWVKIPTLPAATNNTNIYIYYDNIVGSDAQTPAAVWSSNYRGVWHLNPSLTDSSSSANNGTNNLTIDTAGRLGRGRHFNAAAWIDVGSSSSLAITQQLTLEGWVKIDDPNRVAPMRVISKKLRVDSTNGYELLYHPQLNQVSVVSSGTDVGVAGNIDLDTGWHHLAATINGAQARLYVDGVDKTNDGICNQLAAGTQAANLGRRSGAGDYFQGDLDELRISSAARSAAWIKTQYASMTDTLVSFGPRESICGGNDRTCNNRDDDCNGIVDDGVALPLAVTGVSVTKSAVNWSGRLEASGYDLIRGSLNDLAASGGNFSTATKQCLANDTTATSFSYTTSPPTGTGFWFLVRATNCKGGGTYDESSGRQSGSRDGEVQASGVACP